MSKEREYEDSLQTFRREMNKYDILDEKVQNDLLKEYKETGNSEIIDYLVRHNLRLSMKVAKKHSYNRKSMDLMDLIQECNISLILAIETYKVNKDTKFSTYAIQVMENNIITAINKKDSMIKKPMYLEALSIKISRFRKKFYVENDRFPSDEEIIKKLNICEVTLESIKKISNYDIKSLNDINEEDENKSEFQESIPYEEIEYEKIENRIDDAIIIKAAKEILTEEEYYVIFYRKIIEKGLTLKEIGEEFGVKGEAIRLIEKRALEKLKKSINFKQKQIVEKEDFRSIEKENLEPLKLSKKCLFLYLKEKMSEEEYYYVYTKQILDYKTEDYKRENSELTESEIEEQVYIFNDIYQTLALDDFFVEKNFNKYKELYGSNNIFKMSIDVFKKEEKNEKFKNQKKKGRKRLEKTRGDKND